MMRGMPWAIGVALVTVAWGVAFLTPPADAREAPFPVRVEPGEQGTGRNLQVTVDDVHRTDHLSAAGWSADGNWLVVDLTAAAVVRESAASLRLVTFRIDGRTFDASERPDSLREEALAVGIARSGSVAFELPAGLTQGSGILTFGTSTDPRLDSVIEVRVDLGDLPVRDDAKLLPTTWAGG